MKGMTRRDFLRVSALTMGTVVISTGLQGCLSSSSSSRDDDPAAPVVVAFNHGVASGDPLQDRILIWTRVSPAEGQQDAVEVSWEVAEDAKFTRLLHDGNTQTDASRDYTIKVDVLNLTPGQTYFYRFSAGATQSPTGQMKTLPVGSIDQVRFAVLSCSNYPAGYFHVYAEAARQADLDAVVHLGDYIYEYGEGGYASEDAVALGRTLNADNNSELFVLEDYRKRYALYRGDSDLQALHAAAPFIAVWDDHEIANDTWTDGAENHNEGEGDFTERKLAALQAYFEWMPIRPANPDDVETIYRSFDFGDLVSLHMLDTRIIGRNEQLNYSNYLGPGGFDFAGFNADVNHNSRTLLGQEQLNWLEARMANSNATWQVLGQQVLMGRMLLPAELLGALLDPASSDLIGAFSELVELKLRMQANDPTLTDQERARITTVVPYNLDAWDGYAHERELVLEMARSLDKNLVVLAGDTHNAWASDLATVTGQQVGVEFATASVSSPGLEEYLGVPAELIPQIEQVITLLVEPLDYLNAAQRGYMLVTFTAEQARAQWQFVDTIKSTRYQVDNLRSQQRICLPGAANRSLQTPS
ncbi:alkaline phosphatase D family protein [Halopseudomonas pelagia]|uniref:alkaline phosphatase D family protein n=1 Tax=Halopseudomonas pelagia TaxID=553151 RepID=UPI00039D05C7|nr:alkaline phosphatase D family protein [Halopseudomonas pelagia]